MADVDAPMMSKMSIALVASLVANAVLIGIVGGRLLSPPQPGEPTVQMQLERYGPASDVVNAAWKQLPVRTAQRFARSCAKGGSP